MKMSRARILFVFQIAPYCLTIFIAIFSLGEASGQSPPVELTNSSEPIAPSLKNLSRSENLTSEGSMMEKSELTNLENHNEFQKKMGSHIHNESSLDEGTAHEQSNKGFTDNAMNAFAYEMSQEILQNKSLSSGNKTDNLHEKQATLIWSPYSVYQSLLPLVFAAGGRTEEELRKLLFLSNDSLIENSTNIHQYNFEAQNNGTNNTAKMFSSVTGIFSREDVPLNRKYVEEVQKEMADVELKSINFRNVSLAAKNINTWVHESTQGLINENVIEEAQLDPGTFVMIVNCVRFKAPWKTPFHADLTHDSEFHGSNGVQRVRMMSQRSPLKFAKFPQPNQKSVNEIPQPAPFTVLEMPYEGTDLVSLFILPKTTEAIQTTFNEIHKLGVGKIRAGMRFEDVQVSIPKFKISSDVDIENAVRKNGLHSLFTPGQANLTKLMPSSEIRNNKITNSTADLKPKKFIPEPYLSKIVHRTIFQISEEGTKAGAVTSLSIVPLSALVDTRLVEFTLNRPFILLLVQNKTVIFEGIIADLTGQNLEMESELPTNTTENDTSVAPVRKSLVANDVQTVNHEDVAQKGNTPANSTQSTQLDNKGEKPWWIPNHIPEYLHKIKPNRTKVEVSSNSSTEATQAVKETSTETSNNTLANATTSESEKEAILFSNYQQPEPRDPEGIRFPVTIPITRRKSSIIKPRYESDIKNSLIRWINVY